MTTISPASVLRTVSEHSFVGVADLPGSPEAARKAASRAAQSGS